MSNFDRLSPWALMQILYSLNWQQRLVFAMVSRAALEFVSKNCCLRLTTAQREIVDYVLALSPAAYQEELGKQSVKHPSKFVFPPSYTVKSNTSTGKTAIMLAIAQRLVQQGKRVLIVTPSRLVGQWHDEYVKFREIWNLPPLHAIRSPFVASGVPKLFAVPEHERALLLVPTTLVNSRANVEELYRRGYSIALADDLDSLPRLLEDTRLEYAVLFNATAARGVAFTNNDAELGSKPRWKGHVWHLTPFAGTTYSRLDNSQRYGKARILGHKVSYDLQPQTFHRAQANWFALDQIAPLFGRKVVIISFDPQVEREDVYPNGTTHSIYSGQNTDRKAQILRDFQAQRCGQLYGTYTYLHKGFDLSADTLVLLGLFSEPPLRQLVQAIGRVLRVSNRHSKVNIHIVSTSPRTVAAFDCIEKPIRELKDWNSIFQIENYVSPFELRGQVVRHELVRAADDTLEARISAMTTSAQAQQRDEKEAAHFF